MKICISILAGVWGVLCTLLVALSGGVEWATPGAAMTAWISIMAFHAFAIVAYGRVAA